jgi:hypothetical protein
LSSPNQPFGQDVPLSFSILFCEEVYGKQYNSIAKIAFPINSKIAGLMRP